MGILSSIGYSAKVLVSPLNFKILSQAFGGSTGALDFDQYMELVKDAKKRERGFQKEIEELESKTSQEAIDIGVEELCAETNKVLSSLGFSNKKQVVRDIIEKVIIKERSEVEVLCHISLPQLSLTSAQELGHEPISRDSGSA